MRAAALACAAAACGRIGFGYTDRDASTTGNGDALSTDAIDAPPGAQVTVIDSTRMADTQLAAAGNSGNNYGAATTVLIDITPNIRALFRFDLAAIPTTATVFSAQFHISIAQSSGTDPIVASRVLEDWIEGTSNAQPGAASWDERLPGVAWSSPGASAPGSASATPFASWMTSTGAGTYDFAMDVLTVQGWVSSQAANLGFVASANTLKVIASREEPNASARPTLTVIWVP